MKSAMHKRGKKSESGIALLIAIFTLLLISAVAAALLVMSGTESAMNSNYKSSAQAFYDARAGLEEGRGRLWSGNPNALGAFVVASGSTMAAGTAKYILNAANGETVNPTDMSTTNTYADRQYISEWGSNPATNSATTTSVSTQASIAGPLFKWVRITPRTEASSGLDVNGDGSLDSTHPLFYDGSQQFRSDQIPSGANAYQVFEITALSVTPSGSQRLVQYTTAATNFNLTVPAALTFDGPAPVYNAPASNPFSMNGNDRSGSNPMAGCSVPSQTAKPAVGVINNADIATAASNIPSNRLDHYLGSPVGPPSIGNVSGNLSSAEVTVASLQTLVQTISSVANNVLTGPVSNLTAAQIGSASSPQITVVNGDLSLSGNNTGYGMLVVTGNLTFSGTNGWRGVVLVIGQGSMQENGGGNNEFDGAVFVAKTLNASYQPLASLGTPTLNWNGGGGDGVYYDSCWINNASSGLNFKVLSFREISQ